MTTTTLVADLDLPQFEYYADVDGLRGERFHAVMRGLREQGWLASSDARLLRARPRGGLVLPAHAQRRPSPA